jgi:integrase/recombinase XerD
MRLRSVGRSHIISWRKDMERRGLAPASIRRKLSALGDAQARKLLEAPPADTLKGVRDRAILATCSITVSGVKSSVA